MTKKQKQNVRKWIKALRSGKFKQAQGKLFKKNIYSNEKSYCCLGVARNIFRNTSCPLHGEGAMISDGTFERAFGTELNQYKLINLNDEQMASFNDIADYLEEQVSNLS